MLKTATICYYYNYWCEEKEKPHRWSDVKFPS